MENSNSIEIIIFCLLIGLLFIILVGILVHNEQKYLDELRKELKSHEEDIHKGMDMD